MLCLQRAVKTFRLGPHPAPIIPVDVVSRAIVHSALGWGGPLTTTAAAAHVAVAASIPRRRPRDLCGTTMGGGGSGLAASSCPEVMIRNLAWATHPFVRGGGAGPAAPQKRDGAGDDDVDYDASGADEAAGDGEEGRMPSFREFSELLYDYAVLRGLRPSFEALAMTSSFAAGSVLPVSLPAILSGGRAQGSSRDRKKQGEHPQQPAKAWGESLGLRASSRLVFDAMHVLLNRSPVWALQAALTLATKVERLGTFCCGNRRGGGHGNIEGGGGAGATATLRRLDKLAELPAVYEAFTWRQYFFDSALRVPGDLTPEGYALETALASEMLQESL